MAKIIFAEDNISYAEDVADFLVEAGYQVQLVSDAAGLWQALSEAHADVVLLDLGLPDEDGFHVIPKIRKLHPDTGLIILSARVTLDNRIQGLRLGADAYLTKPIKFVELAANIEALGRRLTPRRNKSFESNWTLCIAARRLELKDRGSVDLTEREFNFLHLLAQNLQPVPRKSLLFSMGENFDLEVTGKMDMMVYRMRKKILNAFAQELPLRSEYGGGYALSTPFHII